MSVKYPDRNFLARAVAGKDFGLDAMGSGGLWDDQKQNIIQLWNEVVAMLLEARVRKPSQRSNGLLELWEHTVSPMVSLEAKAFVSA